jgi:hypothetical protein
VLRYFLVPAVVVNGTRGPKYFTLTARHQTIPGTVLAQWEPIDFGNEPSMLVGTDISDAESATLAGMVDVTKFADDLDTPLGARLVAMQSALEALNLSILANVCRARDSTSSLPASHSQQRWVVSAWRLAPRSRIASIVSATTGLASRSHRLCAIFSPN